MGDEMRSPEPAESRVTADAWLSAFAESLGVSAPDATVVQRLLEIAGVAAHASERIAAPIACYLIGLSGSDLTAAEEAANAAGRQLR